MVFNSSNLFMRFQMTFVCVFHVSEFLPLQRALFVLAFLFDQHRALADAGNHDRNENPATESACATYAA